MSHHPRGRTPRILLIEDNEADADLVRTAIARSARPFLLCVAPTARKAVADVDAAIAGDDVFDLILLDLNLPDRPGLDLLCSLRERTRMGAIFILVLTSSKAPTDREQALLRGASQIMAKHSDWRPFFDGLMSALESHLPTVAGGAAH